MGCGASSQPPDGVMQPVMQPMGVPMENGIVEKQTTEPEEVAAKPLHPQQKLNKNVNNLLENF